MPALHAFFFSSHFGFGAEVKGSSHPSALIFLVSISALGVGRDITTSAHFSFLRFSSSPGPRYRWDELRQRARHSSSGNDLLVLFMTWLVF